MMLRLQCTAELRITPDQRKAFANGEKLQALEGSPITKGAKDALRADEGRVNLEWKRGSPSHAKNPLAR